MTMGPRSLFGRMFGLGKYGQLTAKGGSIDITQKAVDVSGTISAEGASVANQRDISLTVKDQFGRAVDSVTTVELIVYASSAMLDWGVGGSTGIAAGANGKILALVAKKIFRAQTTAAGLLDVIYTDTGTDAGYLAVRLPGGRVVGIGVITNA